MKKSLWWKLSGDKKAVELIIQERESKRYHLWTNAEDRVLQMLKDKTNNLPAKSKLKSLLPSDEQCTIRWNFLQRIATNSSSSSNSKDSLKKDQQSNKRQRQYQAKQKKAKQELQKQNKAKQELHQRKTQQDRLFKNRMKKIDRDKELDRVAQIRSTRNQLKRERERVYQRKKAEEDDKRRRLDRQEEERQEDAANERRWRHAREEKDRQRRSCARKEKTQTHYQILGVHWKATDTEIKKAYRTLAMKHHPDKNNAKEAEAIMVQINSAYECLKSITKRKEYDYTLNTNKEESIDHSEHEQNVNYQQGNRHDQDEQNDEQNQDYEQNQDLPDHYICYRCNNRGHHSDHCPDCPVSSTNYYQPTYSDVQTFYQETTHLH